MDARRFFAHGSAIVEATDVGDGTRIWAFTHVMPDVVVGRDCNVGSHCFLETGAVIGDGVTIKNGNMVWEGVTIEKGAFIGPGVVFTNDRHPRSPRLPQASERYVSPARWLAPTHVREGASLGAGSVILPGLEIGPYAVVGAGAVVTRDVPSHAIVVGSPARKIGLACECGQRLEADGTALTCPHCGRRFQVREGVAAVDRS